MRSPAKRKILSQKHEKGSDPMPADTSPMLATLSDKVFNDNDWTYEIKWDGYRIIATVIDGKVRLNSRGGLNFTKTYTPLVDALEKLGADCILDGEVVVLNEEGKPDFDALQAYRDQPLVYYVFDVLWSNGNSHLKTPLTDRKQILSRLLSTESEAIRYSEDFEDGVALFEQVEKLQLEGIIAKKKTSLYTPGKRSRDWLKLPTAKRQEFVIGGWSESESGRAFRSLIFGYYENGKLTYVGHAGGGYKEKEMKTILNKLKKIEITKSPFVNAVDVDGVLHWVRPELIAEIKYSTLTKSGKIRKPAIFLGFRKDKTPDDVIKEMPINTLKEKQHTSNIIQSNWSKIDKQKITSEETFTVDGFPIKLQNIEKRLWEGVTKADLIQYYHQVSSYLLPYLKDRPQSMHLKLLGPTRPGFYIKDMEEHQPQFAEVFSVHRKHKKEDRRDIIDYLVCQNEATLLYMINLGCIDINPWTATTHKPTEPDYIVIDLDPSDEDFNKVVETATAARQIFDKYKLKVFPKTSGKTGMHLLIPCIDLNFSQARVIAENICNVVHNLVPSITTTQISVAHRGSNLYLDPNQNDEADTIAAPYSVRPWRLPSVSTPIDWKEIRSDLDPYAFTLKTILKRLEKKGDLHQDVLLPKHKINNTKVLLKHFM